jgi:hypothetical protein
MRASLEVIQTATRVLTDLTDQRKPDPADIERLRDYDEETNGRDLDELACDVIQKALRRRAELRRGLGPRVCVSLHHWVNGVCARCGAQKPKGPTP